MSSTKLILFEGVPGSGKSTAAAHLQEHLAKNGFAAQFWREGNFDHPADFEGVACLSETEYQGVLSRYPTLADLFSENGRCGHPLFALLTPSYPQDYGCPVCLRDISVVKCDENRAPV